MSAFFSTMPANSCHAQAGLSLIGLLLVPAIIAALFVAAFIVYSRVQAGRNASYEAQVLSTARAGVKAYSRPTTTEKKQSRRLSVC